MDRFWSLRGDASRRESNQKQVEQRGVELKLKGACRKSIHQRSTLTGTARTFSRQPGACEDRQEGGKKRGGESEQENLMESVDGAIVLIRGWPF